MALPSAPDVLKALRSRGLRDTRPRRAVVSAALSRVRFTALDLVEELKPIGVGRATVFRTLEVLEDVGVLEQLHTDEHHSYTVCSGVHHHHLICQSCSNVLEITSRSVERTVEDIAESAGYRLQGHLLEIFGICPECLRREHTAD